MHLLILLAVTRREKKGIKLARCSFYMFKLLLLILILIWSWILLCQDFDFYQIKNIFIFKFKKCWFFVEFFLNFKQKCVKKFFWLSKTLILHIMCLGNSILELTIKCTVLVFSEKMRSIEVKKGLLRSIYRGKVINGLQSSCSRA